MRNGFSVLVLCLAAFYTYAAFTELSFLSSTGRLGPGFFPRIIGVTLVLACLFELGLGARRGYEPVEPSDHVRTTATVAALTGLFVLSLGLLGGYLAMIAFMFVTLTYLNRGRLLQNAAIALVLPTLLWVMFERWLNASLPEGLLASAWLAGTTA